MTISNSGGICSDALGLVSQFAAQTFSQADDALNALLAVAQKILGYQTVLISQIDP
jgi:hypothetical protein